MLVGNGFTVLLAVSCGLGAFALVTSEERRSGSRACAPALPRESRHSASHSRSSLGVAIYLIVERDWRRLWIRRFPRFSTSSGGCGRTARCPAATARSRLRTCWRYRRGCSSCSATPWPPSPGLAYDFGGGEIVPALATTLAVAGIALVRLVAEVEPVAARPPRSRPSSPSRRSASSSPASSRSPDDGRYLYPAAIACDNRGRGGSGGGARRPPCSSACTRSSIIGAAANLLQLSNEARVQRETTTPRPAGVARRARTLAAEHQSGVRPGDTPGTTRSQPSPSPGTARRSRETRRPSTWSLSAATGRSASPRPRFASSPRTCGRSRTAT